MRFKLKSGKLVLIILFVLALISCWRPNSTLAFSTPSARGGYLFSFEGAVFKTDEMNLQSFVNETFKALGASIHTTILGCWTCSRDERDKYPGLLSEVSSLIASTYASPPASGVYYLAKAASKIGLVQPAYAQDAGTGFSILESVQPVWTAFRNISYLFFVLILVFMGFAIMFRLKINPQTVVTIQSALPNIVLVLLLITFSYAIAGFLIDIMLVLVWLVISIFKSVPITNSISLQNIFDRFNGIVDLIPGVRIDLGFGFFDLTTFLQNLNFWLQTIATWILFAFVFPFLSFMVMGLFNPLGWLFVLIVLIISLVALIRIAWLLLKTYALVIIGVVFAPFQLLVGVIPGSKAIGSWFRNFLANIAVLPTVVAMWFLASYLMFKSTFGFFEGQVESLFQALAFFFPGSTFNPTGGIEALLGILGDVVTGQVLFTMFNNFILSLVGIAIFLMIPKAADMIKSVIAGQPFQFGAAIKTGMAPVVAPVSYVGGLGKAAVEKGVTDTGAQIVGTETVKRLPPAMQTRYFSPKGAKDALEKAEE